MRTLVEQFKINGHEASFTIRFNESGEPESFSLRAGPYGSDLAERTEAFSRDFSLELKNRVPLTALIERFRGTRFEPYGPTKHPQIPFAESVVDFAVRVLAIEFPSGKLVLPDADPKGK